MTWHRARDPTRMVVSRLGPTLCACLLPLVTCLSMGPTTRAASRQWASAADAFVRAWIDGTQLGPQAYPAAPDTVAGERSLLLSLLFPSLFARLSLSLSLLP